MEKQRIKCKTIFKEGAISIELADQLFLFLKHNIKWEDGIRSKKGFTRKAKSLSFGELPEVDDVIVSVLNSFVYENDGYVINGIYLNYYENETMWTPNHSHKGTHQLIISLGASRTLQVGKKDYIMKNSDAIIFGSSIHGVPRSDTPKTERISIATFMTPINIDNLDK